MSIQTTPKFAQLAEMIEREVIPEARSRDGKIVSEVALSKRYGVSTITVSKALASLVSKGVLERIGGSGTFVRQASPRKKSGLRSVVAVMPLLLKGHQELSACVARELQARHIVPCVFDGNNTEALRATLPEFLGNRPFGVIVDGNSNFPYETLDALHKDTRLVFISHFEGPRNYSAASVLYDHEGKGRVAVRHLIGLGRRRIAVINMEVKPRWSSDLFWKGCQEAFAEAEIEPAAHLNSDTASDADYDKLLDGRRPIDGVVAIADHRLFPILERIKKRGMRIPDDVALIGGNNTDWSIRYDLSSMEPMDRELAAEAVNVLEDGRLVNMRITPGIVFRGSCPKGL